MSKKKILIIDDDPNITESVQIILESHNYEVHTANSGADGLDSVKNMNPDLVFCDMTMEKVDEGTIVMKKIKEINPDLPVYLLSAIGDVTAENVEIETLGFKGVIQKPITPETLLNVTKKILGE